MGRGERGVFYLMHTFHFSLWTELAVMPEITKAIEEMDWL